MYNFLFTTEELDFVVVNPSATNEIIVDIMMTQNTIKYCRSGNIWVLKFFRFCYLGTFYEV